MSTIFVIKLWSDSSQTVTRNPLDKCPLAPLLLAHSGASQATPGVASTTRLHRSRNTPRRRAPSFGSGRSQASAFLKVFHRCHSAGWGSGGRGPGPSFPSRITRCCGASSQWTGTNGPMASNGVTEGSGPLGSGGGPENRPRAPRPDDPP
jgi:hypothetical protein